MIGENNKIMIEADRLTKRYGNLAAIEDISFACRQGEVVGFLGPNGAGKTTTMRILTGYMPPTSGEATIAGYNAISQSIEARRHLGYLPETVPLYREMTVEGYLAYVGRLRRVEDLWDKVDNVLEAVGLLDRAESYIGRLSKGMRQRVGLAQALLHDPDVLILDEPTIGLDPAQIKEVRQLIVELGKQHTILLSTHILSEVEQICNRVIMVINGRIWADMPIHLAMGGETGHVLNLSLANPDEETVSRLSQLAGVREVYQDHPPAYRLTYDGQDQTRIQVAEMAVTAGWGLLEMSSAKTSLENLFMDKLKEAEEAAILPAEDFTSAAPEDSWELEEEE